MNMWILAPLLSVVLIVSGCTGYFLNEGTGGYEKEDSCGYYGEPCCEWYGQNEFGAYEGRVWCEDGLECRAGSCWEGPDIEARGRGEF